ncbi:MAG: hydroxyacylglutathione hydrolase [Mariprofundaceae bacterium]
MWTYEHPGFNVHQLAALSDNYIYLIEAHNSNILAAVDPAKASTVKEACSRIGKDLTHILNTHHHWDHTGANVELKSRYKCNIIGPSYDAARIPGMDVQASEGTPVQIDALTVDVLFVPGHTRGHIAFVIVDALFCGDTLFAGGCGRLFEGTPEQMWQSLRKLAALPGDTKVYCAHEYTLPNLRFARSVDADNAALEARIHRDTQARMEQKPTVPSDIAEELATNPFLRPLSPDFCTGYAKAHGLENDPVRVFAHLRASKDKW